MSKQCEIYVWGSNESSQLLDCDKSKLCSPRLIISPVHINSVSISQCFSYFLSDSGDLYSSLSPLTLAFPNLKSFKVSAIDSGCSHTIVLTPNGTVYSWGKGDTGALGLNSIHDTQTPIRIPLPKALQISCGARHTGCLTTSGVYMWGSGSFGQLGLGNINNAFEPQMLGVDDISFISCGIQYTMILNKKGQMLAFGNNSCGQFGTGNKRSTNVPVIVENTPAFKMLSCGTHTAGISMNDELFVWGTGLFGEWLTPKYINEVIKPIKVTVNCACGYAIDNEKNVWSWGSNTNGELGLGDFDQRTSVKLIKILKNRNIKNIYSGNSGVFAIGKDFESIKKPKRRHPSCNKENIFPIKDDKQKLEVLKLKQIIESKEQKINSLEQLINEDQIPRIQQENEHFRTAFEEMKKFKQQCYHTLSQEKEKRKIAENFVKELHDEHKMLVSTIEELEKTMAKLSHQCEIYQEKAAQSDVLLSKIKILNEENEKLRNQQNSQESLSKRYKSDVSYDLMSIASPEISIIFDKKIKKDNSVEMRLRNSKSSSDLIKMFEAPEPIRSISPAYANKDSTESIKVISNDPQTPPTFRDGGIASGGVKNSLSEIRARLNLLQENKLELEGKMNDFEKKLKEQL
ncbi:hypothetical protein SteCoe_22701 [Stentor coeruleus]|uniref:RCC1-like domain-containing protein n=1 Tax=Stentor coeruleus TaxID=5963 RepID=A0A1R2BLN6_9CILI|nr:hypothetical protein SteCoe_22701 [Stentor coeruleus]